MTIRKIILTAVALLGTAPAAHALTADEATTMWNLEQAGVKGCVVKQSLPIAPTADHGNGLTIECTDGRIFFMVLLPDGQHGYLGRWNPEAKTSTPL
jgi:hypothetical protein